jgi:hypothetical protein
MKLLGKSTLGDVGLPTLHQMAADAGKIDLAAPAQQLCLKLPPCIKTSEGDAIIRMKC